VCIVIDIDIDRYTLGAGASPKKGTGKLAAEEGDIPVRLGLYKILVHFKRALQLLTNHNG